MLFESFSGDIFHHQEWSAVMIDSYVVKLNHRGMRKLTDDLRFTQELLLEIFVQTIGKSFYGHRAANHIIARFVHTARGSAAD